MRVRARWGRLLIGWGGETDRLLTLFPWREIRMAGAPSASRPSAGRRSRPRARPDPPDAPLHPRDRLSITSRTLLLHNFHLGFYSCTLV